MKFISPRFGRIIGGRVELRSFLRDVNIIPNIIRSNLVRRLLRFPRNEREIASNSIGELLTNKFFFFSPSRSYSPSLLDISISSLVIE